jgi:hypothetical protein
VTWLVAWAASVFWAIAWSNFDSPVFGPVSGFWICCCWATCET